MRYEVRKLTEHGIEVSWETIDKRQSDKWIEKSNGNYRMLRNDTVLRYTEALKSDNWNPRSGATISISDDDQVLDGQHRLHAISISGIPMSTLVIRGVVEEDAKTIDTGLSRKISDYLRHMGIPNSNNIASLCRLTYLAERNLSYWDGANIGRRLFDVSMCLDVLDRHKSMHNFIKLNSTALKLMTPSILSFVMYWGGQVAGFDKSKSIALAQSFCEGFGKRSHNGIGLNEDDSRVALNKKMSANREAKQKIAYKYKMAYCVIAWNKFLLESPVKIIKWTDVGDRPSPFPKFVTADEFR